MAAEQRRTRSSSLAVRPDQPLIGIVLVEDGQKVTRYFVDEAEVGAAAAAQTLTDARALTGAWSDLDWEDMSEELDRIRHQSTPTPPIDEL